MFACKLFMEGFTLYMHLKYSFLFFYFHRDAVLPVTCGAFLLYFGTCTQGTQHPDVKRISQSVSRVCKKR